MRTVKITATGETVEVDEAEYANLRSNNMIADPEDDESGIGHRAPDPAPEAVPVDTGVPEQASEPAAAPTEAVSSETAPSEAGGSRP